MNRVKRLRKKTIELDVLAQHWEVPLAPIPYYLFPCNYAAFMETNLRPLSKRMSWSRAFNCPDKTSLPKCSTQEMSSVRVQESRISKRAARTSHNMRVGEVLGVCQSSNDGGGKSRVNEISSLDHQH